jgi:sigma-B regulation protein RsbQ
VSIIHSTEDEFAPAAVGRYLQSQLRGSSLFEIEASGHCPHLTHPELVTGVLRRILTAAAGPDRQVS